MNTMDTAALLAAGLGAGLVNAVAGGGSLITFPTLVAIGLPPVAANVSNSLAVSPGYVASVYGSRRELGELAARRTRRTLWRLLPTACAGASAGCALLLLTPARAFGVVVPFLVLAATLTLAFTERLRRLVGHPRDLSPRRRGIATQAVVGLGTVYGGYFGAALGVMMVAALGLVLDEDLPHLNALKNAVSAVAGLVTVVAFAAFGPVDWVAVAIVGPASLIGGYTGARLARWLPARVLRATIVVIGSVAGVLLLLRARL
jgi:uncharacterized membrane protein YfcA